MYIEPTVYQHIEVIMGLARQAGHGGRCAADVAAATGLPPATVAQRLRALAAAGLLEAAPGRGEPLFALARAPDAITLADISAVADPQGAAPDDPLSGAHRPGAQRGVAALSQAVARTAQQMMAGVTVADLLPDNATPRSCWPLSEHEQEASRYAPVTPATLWYWVRSGQNHVVVDVRRHCEQGEPAPPWARWMPLERLAHLQTDLPTDRPIITVCATGARSEIAAQYLRIMGFEHACALRGGLAAWHSDSGRD